MTLTQKERERSYNDSQCERFCDNSNEVVFSLVDVEAGKEIKEVRTNYLS